MDDLKSIAYMLTSGGSCRCPGGIQLLYERDNELVEELWDGTEVQAETTVGDGIRKNAPMVYSTASTGNTEQRFVFSADQNNRMKAFVFDEKLEEWEDYDLGSDAGRAAVHRESALAAENDPDGLITVFFLNASRKLQVLQQNPDGVFELGPELSGACPRPGTPMSAVLTPKCDLYLFYLGVDNVMHYHVKMLGTDKWQDHRWEAVKVEEPVRRFKVSFDPESSRLEAFLLTKGRLLRFDGDAPQQDIGRMHGREFIPSSSAQCVRRTFMSHAPVFRSRMFVGWPFYRRIVFYDKNYTYTCITICVTRRFYPV